MSLVKLTVVSIDGGTNYAGETIFDTTRMMTTRALEDETTFRYDNRSKTSTIVVSESFATVSALVLDADLVNSGAAKQVVAILDATSGKAIGTHDLADAEGNDIYLPDDAVITNAYYVVKTTFTSSTDAATISLGVETDDVAGIKAAVAISNGANPYDAGNKAVIQDGTVTNFSEKTTDARKLQAVVAVEALTAGVLVLYADYVIIP